MWSPRGHQPARLHVCPSPIAGLQFLDVVLGGLHCNGSSLSDMNGTHANVRMAAARRRVEEKSSPPVVSHTVKAKARPETPPRMAKRPFRRAVPATNPASQRAPSRKSTRMPMGEGFIIDMVRLEDSEVYSGTTAESLTISVTI